VKDAREYAHDLNGALSTILTSAELALQRERGGAAAGEQTLARIQVSARQAGELAQSLLQAATGTNAAACPHERDLEYLQRIHAPIDTVLADLEARGLADGIPIVFRDTGRMLSVMTTCVRAANILEIGTAYGYSTLWFAKALPENGRIVTIDPDRSRTDIAREFWRRAGVAERIEVVNQPALRVLPNLPHNDYDIVFIDALKEEYIEYLEASLPLLKKYGLVMVDNLLWHHAAAQPPRADDPETTTTIRRFNDLFLHHPQLEASIIPVGDGLGIGAKTS